MKISVDWLSDFVDLGGIPPADIAEQLTVRTAEVEGWEILHRSVAGVVIVTVLESVRIPAADRPRFAVVVNAGSREYRTVCGAPNVRVGLRAAFAPVGTVLAGDKRVEAATLYGHPSEGVLCSPAELGMGAAHEGLLECPPSLAPGAALADHVPAQDMIIEIDNKSLTHRPDLWGHYGFAREMAAIFDRPLRPYPVADLSVFGHLPAYDVAVESHEDCPVYAALEVAVESNPPSPLVVQRRLHALGSNAINSLVDVTNYVQLELGQPTHAFDASRVGRIRVRRAGQKGKFTTLDGKTWDLLPDDLLIQNGDTPVALAGIMGGAGSEVQPTTRRILLESANFKGSRIRMTSVRLALRTDSSLRFEKKLPPLFVKLATGRILHLLAEAGMNPAPTSRFSVVGDLKEASRLLTLPPGYLTRRAGAPLDNTLASRILGSIGLACTEGADGSLTVAIPPFRSTVDLSIPEDISEEVMRLFGYDQIPPALPVVAARAVPPHTATRNHHRMRRVLSQAHQFVEVQTYSWMADDWNTTLGYTPGATLNLRNPIAVDRRRMRDTLVPNVLAIVSQNRKIRDTFRIFELGRVFWLAEGAKFEENHLAGVSVAQGSPEANFRAMRGVLDDLGAANGLAPFTYTVTTHVSAHPWLAAGMALDVSFGSGSASGSGGAVIGHLGLLPAGLVPRVVDSGNVVWFALRVPPLEGALYPATACRPVPVYPGSWQDFTFVFPVAQGSPGGPGPGWAGLDAALGRFTHACLERRSFVDFYRAKGSDTGNYSVRFELRLADRTLGSDDIEDFRARLLAFFAEEGLRLV